MKCVKNRFAFAISFVLLSVVGCTSVSSSSREPTKPLPTHHEKETTHMREQVRSAREKNPDANTGMSIVPSGLSSEARDVEKSLYGL
ncbi:MAG: hypothetical protein Q4D38_11925 [Planctomycetia bacterium]|nr:hypothetical protein [Planctomycetia bacterium]